MKNSSLENKVAILDDKGRILIVDDEAHNRLLAKDVLENEGHKVFEASDGFEALQILDQQDFDLLLLDVMMPGMDGFELCKRIRRQESLQRVPILLLTALSDRDSRLQGIESGAMDYLTKPIDIRELPARARNYIYSKKLSDKLQSYLAQIEELSKLRENLTEMMVHDLRTPLMGLLNSLELLHMRSASALSDKENQNLNRAQHLVLTLIEMVSSILDVSRFEAGSMPLCRESLDLKVITQSAYECLGALAKSRSMEFDFPDSPVFVNCDGEIIRRVLVNLIGNALKFTPRQGQIKVTLTQSQRASRMEIFNTGAYIPEENRQAIFGKFQQLKMRQSGHRYSTGLGLTFCKLALEAHGGRIGVDSEVDVGSTFWFEIPVLEEQGHHD